MNIYKFSTSFFIATFLILVSSCAENNNAAEVEQQKEKVMTEVIIKTSLGDINLELNNEKFPKIVEFPQTHGKVGLNLSKIQLNNLG